MSRATSSISLQLSVSTRIIIHRLCHLCRAVLLADPLESYDHTKLYHPRPLLPITSTYSNLTAYYRRPFPISKTMSTPSPEFVTMVEQIQESASAVWPGPGRLFEVRVLRSPSLPGGDSTNDVSVSVSAVLVEVGAAKGVPRTMSGFYATEEEAIGDVDRQLKYMVEEERELQAIAA